MASAVTLAPGPLSPQRATPRRIRAARRTERSAMMLLWPQHCRRRGLGQSYESGRWGSSDSPTLSNGQSPRWVKGSPLLCFHLPQGGVISRWTLHHDGCLLPLCTWPRVGPGVGSSPSKCRSRAEGWTHPSPPAQPHKSVLPALKFRNSSWRLVCKQPTSLFSEPPFIVFLFQLGEEIGWGWGGHPIPLSPLLWLWDLTPQQVKC